MNRRIPLYNGEKGPGLFKNALGTITAPIGSFSRYQFLYCTIWLKLMSMRVSTETCNQIRLDLPKKNQTQAK